MAHMKTRQAKKVLRQHMSQIRYERGGYYRSRTIERACYIFRRERFKQFPRGEAVTA